MADSPVDDLTLATALDGGEFYMARSGADRKVGADDLVRPFVRVRVVDTTGAAVATAYENGDTIDGVVLATGDAVLRATSGGNAADGVYVVPASGAASRKVGFTSYDEHPGAYFSVMEGTAKADTLWRCTSNKGGTLETTAIAITEFTAGLSGLGASDNRLVRTDGTGGNAAQNSAITVDDSGNMSAVGTLDTTGQIHATLSAAFAVPILAESTEGGTGAGPFMSVRRSSASPAANDDIGSFLFQGRNDAAASVNYAQITTQILDPVSGSEDSQIRIATMVAGIAAYRVAVGSGFTVGSPTGGDKGAGTINATAVYDDNTLLTCYPFDAYLDGSVDDTKWDAKVPDRQIEAVYEHRETDTGKKDKKGNPVIRHERVLISKARIEPRRHEDMRKFKARLGTDTDPLDLDKYIAHWREKRHLTSLPNEEKFDPVQGLPAGAWIQRLVETVEIQAIHISQLHERLKALEERS
jgi:hypothetical protein